MPVPPYSEQERIANKIDSLNPLIERYGQIESEYSSLIESIPGDLRASILQAAVQGKLVPQDPDDEPAEELVKRIRAEKQRLIREGKIKKERNVSEIHRRDGHWYETIDGKDERCIDDEIPFDIPESWTFSRIKSIVLYDLGGATPSKSKPEFWNGDIKWASVRDLNTDILVNTERTITQDGLMSCSSNIIPKGEIIVCTRVGLGKIVLTGDDVAINQDLRGLILSSHINRMYFIDFYKTLQIVGTGTTVKGITKEFILSSIIPIPPSSEQNKIVDGVFSIFRNLDSYQDIISDYSSNYVFEPKEVVE